MFAPLFNAKNMHVDSVFSMVSRRSKRDGSIYVTLASDFSNLLQSVGFSAHETLVL